MVKTRNGGGLGGIFACGQHQCGQEYERNEMTLSIEAAKKLAKILDTRIGYLLGESEEANLFKDPMMLKRFQDISLLPEKEKECILTTVDHFIRASKIAPI